MCQHKCPTEIPVSPLLQVLMTSLISARSVMDDDECGVSENMQSHRKVCECTMIGNLGGVNLGTIWVQRIGGWRDTEIFTGIQAYRKSCHRVQGYSEVELAVNKDDVHVWFTGIR